mmetsp:Transcript_103503/g.281174  ORF Transcript_103503/g.281174 Transcript_103503/m.281174 type:complete len:222 (-) Transcript_103503:254-919(-)
MGQQGGCHCRPTPQRLPTDPYHHVDLPGARVRRSRLPPQVRGQDARRARRPRPGRPRQVVRRSRERLGGVAAACRRFAGPPRIARSPAAQAVLGARRQPQPRASSLRQREARSVQAGQEHHPAEGRCPVQGRPPKEGQGLDRSGSTSGPVQVYGLAEPEDRVFFWGGAWSLTYTSQVISVGLFHARGTRSLSAWGSPCGTILVAAPRQDGRSSSATGCHGP